MKNFEFMFTVEEFFDSVLVDDNTHYGGTSHHNETLYEFICEICEDDEKKVNEWRVKDLSEINHILKRCGIKPINTIVNDDEKKIIEFVTSPMFRSVVRNASINAQALHSVYDGEIYLMERFNDAVLDEFSNSREFIIDYINNSTIDNEATFFTIDYDNHRFVTDDKLAIETFVSDFIRFARENPIQFYVDFVSVFEYDYVGIEDAMMEIYRRNSEPCEVE